MTEDTTDVLNAKEAVASLKAHVETIRRLAWPSKIPAFKGCKDCRFHGAEMRRWVEVQNPSL